MDRRVTLAVKGAEKRDAGRGVARLPEAARRSLGVLSGDTIVIEGERPTVVKVWPGGEEGTVRIDAETRANAGVNIGESVTVGKISVAEADRVVVELPAVGDEGDVADAVASALRDRPLQAGEVVTA